MGTLAGTHLYEKICHGRIGEQPPAVPGAGRCLHEKENLYGFGLERASHPTAGTLLVGR